jgi:hypothetical protein
MAGKMSRAILATVALALGGVRCAIVPVSGGVVGGVDLPSDPSLVLREGMPEGDLIARFGAPMERTRAGRITETVYTEVYQNPTNRLRIYQTPAGPDGKTRTRLHLVFLDDSLIQAWVEVSEDGQATETRWILGAPEGESGEPAVPPPAR